MKKHNNKALKCLIRFLLPAFMLFALFTMISCTGSVPRDLIAAEKLWKDQGLTDYDFTLERHCFCPPDWLGPVNIQVCDGIAVSVTYLSSGTAVTGGQFDNASTIEKLFTILKKAYSGESDWGYKADTINVTYDTVMGYPAHFYIDYSKTAIDEEQGYTVTNLVAR